MTKYSNSKISTYWSIHS